MKLNSLGYYVQEDGRLFFPVGANYWPSSCGVEMWIAWPEVEIAADLDLVVALGLNSIRFFTRWQDFEPVAGDYSETAFARLDRFLELCAARGLRAQPSFFVGWMSGGLFWPDWKGGRNLFADDEIVERSVAYARTLARRLRAHTTTLLGIDLGNELDALAESRSAAPASVRRWCERVTSVIREELTGVLIHSGCDKGQVTADAGWRLGAGAQPGIDVITMHGYPVPGWHPVPSGGLRDPLMQSLLPYYVACARAFGPVLLQEFGTIVPGESPHCDAYLRAVLPACLRAGANGFLWWCLRDIRADETHPYAKNDFESLLGLVDSNGEVKPGLRYYVEFARELCALTEPPAAHHPEIALYWPSHYYERDVPENPGNVARESAARMSLANHLLGHAAGVAIVRGGNAVPEGVTTLVIAGSCLTPNETNALRLWVERGGRLLWHGPNAYNWGAAMSALAGADVVDYHAPSTITVDFAGRAHRLEATMRGVRLEVAPRGACVIARDEDGRPAILRHVLGRGVMVAVLADIEGGLLKRWGGTGGGLAVQAEGREWFSRMLALLRSEPGTA
ncbi:MAG: cellulase family glycosylhydrolase [Opitutaceae bacterium]|nr:cellulase family glycosylhydrolase [Opitutaceae bacterium]